MVTNKRPFVCQLQCLIRWVHEDEQPRENLGPEGVGNDHPTRAGLELLAVLSECGASAAGSAGEYDLPVEHIKDRLDPNRKNED